MSSVSEADSPCHLLIDTFPSFARVTVSDPAGRTVSSGRGRAEALVPAGIYAIEVDAGASTERSLVALEPGGRHQATVLPSFLAIAPVKWAANTDDDGQRLADELKRPAGGRRPDPERTSVTLAIRSVPTSPALLGMESAELLQVSLLDASGTAVARVNVRPGSRQMVRNSGAALVRRDDLAPGGYLLRFSYTAAAAAVAHGTDLPLWLPAGWHTLVCVSPQSDSLAATATALHLNRQGHAWEWDHDAHACLELALSDLRCGQAGTTPATSLPADLVEENPYLGMAVGHLAAVGLRGAPTDPELARLVGQLERLLPGHPDVAALRYRHRLDDGDGPPLHWPPSFAAGLHGLVRTLAHRPNLAAADSPAEWAAAVSVQRGAWTTWRQGSLNAAAVAAATRSRIDTHVTTLAAAYGAPLRVAAGWCEPRDVAAAVHLPARGVIALIDQLRREEPTPMDKAFVREVKQLCDEAGEFGPADGPLRVHGSQAMIEVTTAPSAGQSNDLEVTLTVTPTPGWQAARPSSGTPEIPVTVESRTGAAALRWVTRAGQMRVRMPLDRYRLRVTGTRDLGRSLLAAIPSLARVAPVGASIGVSSGRSLTLPSGVTVAIFESQDRSLHLSVRSPHRRDAGSFLAFLVRWATTDAEERLIVPLEPNDGTPARARGGMVLGRAATIGQIFITPWPSQNLSDIPREVLVASLRYADRRTNLSLRRLLAASGGQTGGQC